MHRHDAQPAKHTTDEGPLSPFAPHPPHPAAVDVPAGGDPAYRPSVTSIVPSMPGWTVQTYSTRPGSSTVVVNVSPLP